MHVPTGPRQRVQEIALGRYKKCVVFGAVTSLNVALMFEN